MPDSTLPISPGKTVRRALENALLPFNRNGVLTSCNSFVSSFGAALLDLDESWKVKYRGGPYLLSPQTYYE
jgi:predicted GH43/DUF377 family glycosyl hydrolase